MKENRKLELNDITGYLPYNLKVLTNNGDIEYLKSLGEVAEHNGNVTTCYNGSFYNCGYIENIMPILRPMSDLTKEISINGETIIPLIKIAEIYECKGSICGNVFGYDVRIFDDYQDFYFGWYEDWFYYFEEYYDEMICTGNTKNVDLRIIDLLNKFHFDYRGLIEQGLAININTLPNP